MHEVVITGFGIACPLGVGCETVWSAIEAQQSGVRTLPWLKESGFPVTFGGEIPAFEPKQYVKPRKSLKVMCREIQLAFACTEMAWADAKLEDVQLNPERLGVVLGANLYRSELDEMTGLYRVANDQGEFDFSHWKEAIRELYPLWMLKYLPNMAACHVGIAHDARGPTNTIVEGDVSSLLTLMEAAHVVARGHADVMLAGASSTMLSPIDLAWHAGARMSRNNAHPAKACRPFDADRDGSVWSEGAAMFILESRAHAEQRGIKPKASILGYGRRCEASSPSKKPTGKAIRQAIEAALASSHVPASEIGHVNAHGVATVEDDLVEARAIEETLGEAPVTAPKSFFGNLGAAGGAVELAISLLALEQGVVPPTLNYDTPDPACPVNISREPRVAGSPAVLALNHKITGQASALVVSAEA